MNVEILKKFLLYIVNLPDEEEDILRFISLGYHDVAYTKAVKYVTDMEREEEPTPDWARAIANGNPNKLEAVFDEAISDLIATWMTEENL